MSAPSYTVNHTRIMLAVESALSGELANGRYALSDIRLSVVDPDTIRYVPERGFDLPPGTAQGLQQTVEWPSDHRFTVLEVKLRYVLPVKNVTPPETFWLVWDSKADSLVDADKVRIAITGEMLNLSRKWSLPLARHAAIAYVRQAVPPFVPPPPPPRRAYRKVSRIIRSIVFNL